MKEIFSDANCPARFVVAKLTVWWSVGRPTHQLAAWCSNRQSPLGDQTESPSDAVEWHLMSLKIAPGFAWKASEHQICRHIR